MTARRRLAIALATFSIVLALTLWIKFRYGQGDADMTYVFCEARAVLNGVDPYATCALPYHGYIAPSYPLTTALYGANFLIFTPYASQVMFSLSCGLLAFAATRRGQWWRLLPFLSVPFFHDLTYLQWAPFILAIYWLPDLLPLAAVKPQLAISVILTNLNRYRFAGLVVFGACTLVANPTWPLEWWHQAQTYDGWIPMLRMPLGPIMLLSLFNWRDPRSWFLFLLAASPQRGFYDLLMLFGVARSWREMVILLQLSWILPFWAQLPIDYRDWTLLIFYLPALTFTLVPALRQWQARTFPHSVPVAR